MFVQGGLDSVQRDRDNTLMEEFHGHCTAHLGAVGTLEGALVHISVHKSLVGCITVDKSMSVCISVHLRVLFCKSVQI